MRLVLLLVFFLPIYISAQDTVSATPKKDIFFIFDVYVMEKANKIPISNCTVTLLGNDGTQVIKFTDSTGKVSFDKNGEVRYINKETNYTFEVTKENRFIAKGKFSTVGDTVSKRYVEEIQVSEGTVCGRNDFPDIQFLNLSIKLTEIPGVINYKDSLVFIRQILIDNPFIILEVQGYSHYSENDQSMKLSQQRAQVCVDYLVENGISKERLVAVGYGSDTLTTISCVAGITNANTNIKKQEMLKQMKGTIKFEILSFDYKPTDK